MLRFLCGQVRKATRGLSSVAFVHGRVVEADDGNPLMACRDLLRRYGTVEGGMGREGWRRVGEMQDGIYVEVCLDGDAPGGWISVVFVGDGMSLFTYGG